MIEFSTMKKNLSAIALAFAAVGLCRGVALGDDFQPLNGPTWTGGVDAKIMNGDYHENGNWQNITNWSTKTLPDSGNAAVFTSSGKTNAVWIKRSEVTAHGIYFGANGYRIFPIGSSSIKLDGTGDHEIVVTNGFNGLSTIEVPLKFTKKTNIRIANESTLLLSGGITGYAFDKSGSGRLELPVANEFTDDSSMSDGTVSVGVPGALGGSGRTFEAKGGTLEFDYTGGGPMTVLATVDHHCDDADGAVVYDVLTETVFSQFNIFSGFLHKRGPALLRVPVPGSGFTLYSTASTGINCDYIHGRAGTLYPENGAKPRNFVPPVAVAEGELRFIGGSASSSITNRGAVVIGNYASNVPASAEPTLTFDGLTYDSTGGQAMYLGYSSGYEGHGNRTAVLRLANSSVANLAGGFVAGYDTVAEDVALTVAITNSTLKLVPSTSLSEAYVEDPAYRTPTVRYLVNDGRILSDTGEFKLNGSVFIDLDNGSEIGSANPALLGVLGLMSGADNRIYGEILVRNGSRFRLSGVTENSVAQDRDLTIAFDGGEWVWGGGSFTVGASDGGHVKWVTRGKGLVIRPAEGECFTFAAPLEGEGGLTVDGPGSVAFADGALAYSGCTVLKGGATLDCSGSQAAVSGCVLGGTGTYSGLKADSPRIASAFDANWNNLNGVPVFADCTLTGYVVVETGCTDEHPLTEPSTPKAVAIAKISGNTQIDLAKWRLERTGSGKVAAKFSLVGDTVYLTPVVRRGAAAVIR